MNPYKLDEGEALPEQYESLGMSPPDFENLVVEVRTYDGNFAEFSRENHDPDIVIHWPVNSEWIEPKTESYTTVMRALQHGRDRQRRYYEKLDSSAVDSPAQKSTRPELGATNIYTTAPGEALAGGYFVTEKDEPGYRNKVVEVHASDGIIAILSREAGDKDVILRWPVDPSMNRSAKGYFNEVMRALEFGKDRLLSLQ